MNSYTVNIYDVSNDHVYTIVTLYKSEALRFLGLHDHEGSTIDMVVKTGNEYERYESIEVYEALSADVEIK